MAVTKAKKLVVAPPEEEGVVQQLVGKKKSKAEKVAEGQKVVEALKSKGELQLAQGTEQRRDQVWRLYQMGVPNEVIAQTFGVTEREVRYDLQQVTQTLSQSLLGVGALGVVSRAYYRYETLKAETAQLYYRLPDDASVVDKLSALRMLRDLEDSQLRMVMSVGAVPKAAKFVVRDQEGMVDGEEFTPEQARAVFKEVIEMVRSQSTEGYEPSATFDKKDV